MGTKFDLGDIELLLESLNYAKLRFESTEYPSYELKRERINRAEAVMAKLRALRNQIRSDV